VSPLLADPDQPALIGVSGGRDSVALLHALATRGTPLIVCHLDHTLRSESAAEAQFVARLAETWKLPLELVREDVAARAARRHLSIETAAREARYEFFAQVAVRTGVSRVIVAHHADDQAETFLLQAMRGAGSSGLAGMRSVTQRVVANVPLEIVRPLLGIWREEIHSYIAEHQLEFIEDPSNRDLAFTRNRVRHEIIPMLESAFGRDVRRALWRSAEILRAEDELLAIAPELQVIPEMLVVPELRAMPLALRRRLVHRWLRQQLVPDVGFVEIEKVLTLLEGSVAKVNLPGGGHARRREKRIFFEQGAAREEK
jgi:tRNA(Ile)-lysidine synthase